MSSEKKRKRPQDVDLQSAASSSPIVNPLPSKRSKRSKKHTSSASAAGGAEITSVGPSAISSNGKLEGQVPQGLEVRLSPAANSQLAPAEESEIIDGEAAGAKGKKGKKKKNSRNTLTSATAIEAGVLASIGPETGQSLNGTGISYHEDTSNTKKKGKRGQPKLQKEASVQNSDLVNASSSQVVSKVKIPNVQTWNLSKATAGQYRDQSILFLDEKEYFLLALPSSLQVCQTSSSSVSQVLEIESDSSRPTNIIASVQSKREKDIVFAATGDARIHKLNWNDGKEVDCWPSSSPVTALAMASFNIEDEEMEFVITCEAMSSQFTIQTPAGPKTKGSEAWGVKAYYSAARREKQSFQILSNLETRPSRLESQPGGGVLVLSSGYDLWIGNPEKPNFAETENVKYKWFSLSLAQPIKTFASRITAEGAFQSKAAKPKALPCVDVAVGDQEGAILIYYDLLSELSKQKASSETKHILPKRLHWHRKPVETIQWTKDGFYLISGGSECTIVTWQLKTGALTFVPNLPSTIRSISTSREGARIAVKLGDNSILVMSNVEFAAKALIAGIQASDWENNPSAEKFRIPPTLKESKISGPLAHLFLRVPLALRITNPAQLLIAAPSSKHRQFGFSGVPHLQTYDFRIARHIKKQQIARSNLTIRNVSGELADIGEPTVYFIKTSCDGQWLATVDIWTPPMSRDGAESRAFEHVYLSRQTEVFLRFWQWNTASGGWDLVTKTKSPHGDRNDNDSSHQGFVLDLASDPISPGFSTIGDDGIVRFWKLKVRRQENALTTPSAKQTRTSPNGDDKSTPVPGPLTAAWICKASVPLPQSIDPDFLSLDPHTRLGLLAYSNDGSALAANFTTCTTTIRPVVHFLSTSTFTHEHTSSGALDGPPLALAFLGRYLIALSSTLRVWDVVTDRLHLDLSKKLKSPDPFPWQSDGYVRAATHLAVNSEAGSFAVAWPKMSTSYPRGRVVGGDVAVFEPSKGAKTYSSQVPRPITAMQAVPGEKSWVLLDSAAEVRVLGRKFDVSWDGETKIEPSRVEGGLEEMAMVFKGFEPSLGNDEDEATNGVGKAIELSEGAVVRRDEPDERAEGMPVVALEQVRALFDSSGPAALPSVGQMFESVVRLFGGGGKSI
ncbi:MAG: hypothetical protein M1814_001125 [Vezdaea aestivalis]|nr:MAG: hypothetical protein M1814_001125 [Vezdaea aestivalis]